MAITDGYLSYYSSTFYPSNITIQPASGFVYSFKRGTMAVYTPAVGSTSNSSAYFSINTIGVPFAVSTVASTTSPTFNTSFIYLTFSESGLIGSAHPVDNVPRVLQGNSHPFSSLNNQTPVTIAFTHNYMGSYIVNFGYTLVGALLS